MARLESKGPPGPLSTSELDTNPRSLEINRMKFIIAQARPPSLAHPSTTGSCSQRCSWARTRVAAGLSLKSGGLGGQSYTKASANGQAPGVRSCPSHRGGASVWPLALQHKKNVDRCKKRGENKK